MIKRALESLLVMAKRLVDDTVPEEDLYAYLRQNLQRLNKHLLEGTLSAGEPRVREIKQSVEQLRSQGMTSLPEIQAGDTVLQENVPQLVHEAGQTALNKGKIMVDSLSSLLTAVNQEGVISEAVHKEIEALMRHIEIRRKAGLDFTPTLQSQEKLRAAASLSLLFTRFTRQSEDIRFLNTSLKLNDWTFQHYRNRDDVALDYLCALLEAEVALQKVVA